MSIKNCKKLNNNSNNNEIKNQIDKSELYHIKKIPRSTEEIYNFIINIKNNNNSGQNYELKNIINTYNIEAKETCFKYITGNIAISSYHGKVGTKIPINDVELKKKVLQIHNHECKKLSFSKVLSILRRSKITYPFLRDTVQNIVYTCCYPNRKTHIPINIQTRSTKKRNYDLCSTDITPPIQSSLTFNENFDGEPTENNNNSRIFSNLKSYLLNVKNFFFSNNINEEKDIDTEEPRSKRLKIYTKSIQVTPQNFIIIHGKAWDIPLPITSNIFKCDLTVPIGGALPLDPDKPFFSQLSIIHMSQLVPFTKTSDNQFYLVLFQSSLHVSKSKSHIPQFSIGCINHEECQGLPGLLDLIPISNIDCIESSANKYRLYPSNELFTFSVI